MQIFIILNLTIAVLLAAVMIAFQKDENGLLLLFGMVLLPSFYALAIGNIVAVFHFWKRHRFRAFLPLLSYLVGVAIFLGSCKYGFEIVTRDTPRNPQSFLTETRRLALADTADQLLETSIKTISTYPSKITELETDSSESRKELSNTIEATLRKNGFQRTYINSANSQVLFCHYSHRRWYEYVYTTSGPPDRRSLPHMKEESNQRTLGTNWYYYSW
jgi:hypothetical protein